MAALLHDIGHFPLSHTLERAYSDIENRRPAEQREREDVEAAKVGRTVNGNQPKTSVSRLTLPSSLHEQLGKWIVENTDVPDGITWILKRHRFSPGEIAAVGSAIAGVHEDIFINQLLHSSLDVDQMDYLIRDARNTGVGYGVYDIEYLIDRMIVVTVDGRRLLCVDEPALHTAEHYLLAKHFYWIQVLYQKTRFIVEEIVTCICRRLLEQQFPGLPSYEMLKEWAQVPDQFMGFDDDLVASVFRNAEAGTEVDADTRALIGMLRRRHLPKCLCEQQVALVETETGEISGLKNGFANECASHNSSSSLDCLLQRCRIDEFPDESIGVGRTIGEYLRTLEVQNADEVLTSHPQPIRIALRSERAFSPTHCRRSDDKSRHVSIIEELKGSLVYDLARKKVYILRLYGDRASGKEATSETHTRPRRKSYGAPPQRSQ